jgi:UDP-N-acetylmuramoylalanine--D-glutamate ligase
MLKYMPSQGVAIIPAAQQAWIEAGLSNRVTLRTFGRREADDYTYREGALLYGDRSVEIVHTPFDNPVTGLAAAAAWAVADACDVSVHCLVEAMRAFEPLPHRMEQVAVLQGVTYVDDSKATNLAALKAAVQMAGGPVRLIAGGQLKEEDLESVKEVLAKGVRTVYLVGEAMEPMRASWEEVVECRTCGTVEDAVQAASADAASGDWVLLSPGCASFDQYPNYKARGEDFAERVRKLER